MTKEDPKREQSRQRLIDDFDYFFERTGDSQSAALLCVAMKMEEESTAVCVDLENISSELARIG